MEIKKKKNMLPFVSSYIAGRNVSKKTEKAQYTRGSILRFWLAFKETKEKEKEKSCLPESGHRKTT